MRKLAQNRQIFIRRRRLLYLRRGLLLLACAAILALLIATPIWIVNRVRNHADDSRDKTKKPGNSVSDGVDTEEGDNPVVEPGAVVLGSEVHSEYAALWDMTEGRLVAAKNANVQANPASITKVMTLLVAVENIDNLDAEYTVPWQVTTQVALDATRAGLNSGDVFTLRDLLYGCILPSGADAAVALAHYVTGLSADHIAEAEARFAEMMNQRAAELGATNTHFVNTSGLHHKDHKTTAKDMALIMAAAMKNETCRQVLMAERYSSPATQSLPPQQLAAGEWRSTLFTGWLGADHYGIVAGKTGYTGQASHTLATYTVGADGHEYVLVTMSAKGSDKAVEDARYLFDTYCR